MLWMLVLLGNLPTHARARLAAIVHEIRANSSGATMVEYSILVGLITAVAILFIVGVGQYVSGAWSVLCASLNGNNINITC